MEETPLNIVLGNEINKWLAIRGKSKTALARYLEIDQAVLSLMLKGQNTPSHTELEKIIMFLSIEAGRSDVMRRIVSYLQIHPRGRTVWDAASLKAMRERRGLTLPMLSNRTGIMTSRLALLELKNSTLPTESEELKLRCVFEESGSSSSHYESEYADVVTLKNAVVPVLKLSDLKDFARGIKLETIVREHSVEDTLWMLHAPGIQAVIAANCEDLQLAMPGIAVLAVGDDCDKIPHQIELRGGRGGEFSLCELVNGTWRPSVFSAPDTASQLCEWALPVLDMIFKPYDLEREVPAK